MRIRLQSSAPRLPRLVATSVFGFAILVLFALSPIDSQYGALTAAAPGDETPAPRETVQPRSPVSESGMGLTAPALEEASCSDTSPYTCEISSRSGWQQTPLVLEAGDSFSVSYIRGAWTVDWRNYKRVGPEGYPPNLDNQIGFWSTCKTIEEFPYARLLGKIEDGPTFAVGRGDEPITADRDGVLLLRINDNEICQGDNDGSVELRLTGGPGGLELLGLEVTQAVQDLRNSVVLIKDKPTYVRAHVRSTSGVVRDVKAKLIGTRILGDGSRIALGTEDARNRGGVGDINVLPSPRRANLDDSFYFEILPAWSSGTVEFEFQGVSHSFTCNERDHDDDPNNDGDCKVTVTFEDTPALDVRIVPILWEDSGGRIHYPSEADIQEVVNEIEAMYPIPSLQRSDPSYYIDWNLQLNTLTIVARLLEQRLIDCFTSGCPPLYLGVIVDVEDARNDPSENLEYLGHGFLNAASGFRVKPHETVGVFSGRELQGVLPHELGHALGRHHTPTPHCRFPISAPTLPWESYPYPNGYISPLISPVESILEIYGFHILTHRIYPPNTSDLMSYCFPVWPSDWTYEGIHNEIKGRFQTSSQNVIQTATADQMPVLVVSGRVTPTLNAGDIGSIYVLTSMTTPTPPTSGTYTLRLEDETGSVLATYPFEPTFSCESAAGCSEGEQVGRFVLAVLASDQMASIRLLHGGQELDSRYVSSHEPAVTIMYPNGGETLIGSTETLRWSASDLDRDPLEYAIQYSTDAGATWQTLATDWISTTYELDLNRIAGTDQGLLRVLASDGFHTAQDQSDATFAVAKRPPQVSIQAPDDNSLYVGDQTVILEGSAYDNEDGQLDDSALSWSSDLDGILGNGQAFAVNASALTEGPHIITLTAQDIDGETDTDSISVQIYRERPALPASLALAPQQLHFYVVQGENSTPQTLSIRNQGDGTINWTATTDQTWIYLSPEVGPTPSDIEVTINPTELSPGSYSGQITITTPDAQNSPQVVDITLELLPSLPSWQIASSPTTDALGDIDLISPTNGWAVGGVIGDHGTILHYDGNTWTLATDTISDTLEAVSMVSDTDGWAVGRSGTIVHYDGANWAPVISPTTQWLTGIDMLSPTEGWAAGSHELLYFDGSSWVIHTTLDDSVTLLDISMVSSNDGWAVGWDGAIYHYDGANWTPFASPTTDRFLSVRMLSATDGWIVGENDSVILHYDGDSWSEVDNPALGGLYDVDFGSPGRIVGQDGIILAFDRTTWAADYSPTTNWLTAVDMLSETEGWAVGNGGSILHYTPTGGNDFNIQLDYSSHTINWDSRNRDGVANPDEWVYFSIAIENTGRADAANVHGKLYNGDSYVDAFGEDGTGEFGSIPAHGGTATSDFFLHTQGATPHQHQLQLSLRLSDDSGNVWMVPFEIEVLDTIAPQVPFVEASPKTPLPGDDVVISALVQDESGVDSVFADIHDPNETISTTLQLYDDGAHFDGAASDGTYANQWATDSIAHDYLVDFETTDGLGNTATYTRRLGFSTRSFTKTSDVLLVIDQWFLTGVNDYYTDALSAIGYDYDLWDTFFRGWNVTSILNQYLDSVAIWASPHGGTGNLGDTSVQESLQAFLDGGGSLFITGQDIGWILTDDGSETNVLYNDYLHASYVQDDIDLYALSGVAGDPIGDGLSFSISGGAGANNQSWPSEIDPIAPAEAVFIYDSGGAQSSQYLQRRPVAAAREREARRRHDATQRIEEQVGLAGNQRSIERIQPGRRPIPEGAQTLFGPQGAVSSGTGALRVDTGIYKAVYFAFGFEAINGVEPRYRVMKKVLEWLGVYPEACPDFVDPQGVDVRDIMTVASILNQAAAWPYDCDGDGVITSADILCVVERWRDTCPIQPLFYDDFENPYSGWFTSDTSAIRWSYQDGEYEILLRNPDWWGGVTAPIGGLTNYSIEADIRRHTGSDSFYGLIFDHVDWDHFYYFIVNPTDQTYSVWKRDPDWTAIVDWTFSPHIEPSDATNHLKVERDGSQITFGVNDQVLATTNDDTYTGSLQVGLYANNPVGGSVPAAVRFDNFKVTLLDTASATYNTSTSDTDTSAGEGPRSGRKR